MKLKPKEGHRDHRSGEEEDAEGGGYPETGERSDREVLPRERPGRGAVWERPEAVAAEAALEREADRLLQAAGAFRRSTGILTGRRLREVAARETSLDALSEAAILELGSIDLWDEMDALAAWCGLTPMQKAVLAMWRLGEYSQEEIARELGCSRRNVQRLLGRALRNVRRGAREFPGTARALFWEEVRQKSRMIYRRPRRAWWTTGSGGREAKA
jgi:DNA-directed RNA polymerase specialized sigma24 family protein